MSDRYVQTTQHLLMTARGMILERGERAFSIEGLAKRAGVGTGTVYERWDNRLVAFADVVNRIIIPEVDDALEARCDPSLHTRLQSLLDSDKGREILALIAEVIFAWRDSPMFESQARVLLGNLRGFLRNGELEEGEYVPVLDWWLTSLAIGWGILHTGKAALPPIGLDAAFVVSGHPTAGREISSELPVRASTSFITPIERDDAVSADIVRVARDMLSSGSARDFSAREVGRRAGVSKNTLYRRFGSRADVIRDVLLTDLNEARYAWSEEVIEVISGPDPVNAAAEAMARTMSRVYDDESTMKRLLEVTIAARTEESLRVMVVEQIRNAAIERIAVVQGLQSAGILHSTIDAEAASWLIQAAPIGTRLVASVGLGPDNATVKQSMRAILGHCVVLTDI